MADNRNAWIDVTRVAAAVGIILCHVDLTGYGAIGTLLGQFLGVRFSVMFFLAVMGFYLEKSNGLVKKRVTSLIRVYGAWSLVYLALSFLMVVLIQGVPLGQFLTGKVRDFFLSGSYYHFWFYPAVIYSLVFIGLVKKRLGRKVLIPLALVLYLVGLLGTGYLPLGRQIPGLRNLYEAEHFEAVMHIAFLGFPSMVFGMAAARSSKKCPGWQVLMAAALYVAESMALCLGLGWVEDPQMLATTPILTILFLRWIQGVRGWKGNGYRFRVISSGMYNVHPLFLAVLGILLPGLSGLGTFLICLVCSVAFGWVLYQFRKVRIIGLFI